MTEIRSFRRVFDLERRIYSVDRFRLNPSGVPVRGVAYLLVLLAAFAVLWRLLPATPGPWYLRELALPAAAASVLALLRLDGRTFHQAAQGYLRVIAGPRRITALKARSPAGRSWRPDALLFVPDGSDHRLRGFRYTGAGAVLVRAPHRLSRCERPRAPFRKPAAQLELEPDERPAAPGQARVVALGAGTTLLVRGTPSR